jgi:hypothetical protein
MTFSGCRLQLRICRQIKAPSVGTGEVSHTHLKYSILRNVRPRALVRPERLIGVYNLYSSLIKSRDRAVGIETGCGIYDRQAGVRIPIFSRIFPFQCRPVRLLNRQASYPMGTVGSSIGVKAAEA